MAPFATGSRRLSARVESSWLEEEGTATPRYRCSSERVTRPSPLRSASGAPYRPSPLESAEAK